MLAVIPSIGASPLLTALVKTLLDDGVDVHVVDNSVEGRSRHLVEAMLSHPRLVWLAIPGQSIYRTWNYGLDLGASGCGNVLVLNDDIVLDAGSALEMDAILKRSAFGIVSFFDRNRLDQVRLERAYGPRALVMTTGAARKGTGHALCGYAFAAHPGKCSRCDEGFLWWCGDDDLFYRTARSGHDIGVACWIEVQHPKDGTSSDSVQLPYGWKAHDIDRLEGKMKDRAASPPSASGSAAGIADRYLALVKASVLDGLNQPMTQGCEAGTEWPSRALTMIGSSRIDNIRFAVLTCLSENVPGDFIETGVWRGGATIFMRAILAAYGVTDRCVWVADSFCGLPKPNAVDAADFGDRHHTFTELAITEAEVQGHFARYGLLDDQVKFLPGWFKDTLAVAPIDQIAVLRLDGDMYASTRDAIEALYPKLSRGGFCIVDDYHTHPAQCARAISDYREACGITEPIVEIAGTGIYWRRR